MRVIDTKEFFLLVRTHYGMPEEDRDVDLRGRLSAVAYIGATGAKVDKPFTPLTHRCLNLFLRKKQVAAWTSPGMQSST